MQLTDDFKQTNDGDSSSAHRSFDTERSRCRQMCTHKGAFAISNTQRRCHKRSVLPLGLDAAAAAAALTSADGQSSTTQPRRSADVFLTKKNILFRIKPRKQTNTASKRQCADGNEPPHSPPTSVVATNSLSHLAE